MANYQSLKAAINAVIKANGNKEITGTVLNEVLLAMVNSLGAGYQFMGVATPSTNPGTPDQNVFYIAGQAGTYTNFNSIILPNGVSVLKWNGSWSSETIVAGDGVFDISAYKATGGTLATFADLSAALDGGNNIPSALRKGGMSVKFVNSNNKYVQFRLMLSEFTISQFTDVANWQGVDNDPTAGSDNLVKSGGIEMQTRKSDLLIDKKGLSLFANKKINITQDDIEQGGFAYSKKVDNAKRLRCKFAIPVTSGTRVDYNTHGKEIVLSYANTINASSWRSSQEITGTGSQTLSFNGFLFIIVRNTDDSNISVSDYNCEISITNVGLMDLSQQLDSAKEDIEFVEDQIKSGVINDKFVVGAYNGITPVENAKRARFPLTPITDKVFVSGVDMTKYRIQVVLSNNGSYVQNATYTQETDDNADTICYNMPSQYVGTSGMQFGVVLVNKTDNNINEEELSVINSRVRVSYSVPKLQGRHIARYKFGGNGNDWCFIRTPDNYDSSRVKHYPFVICNHGNGWLMDNTPYTMNWTNITMYAPASYIASQAASLRDRFIETSDFSLWWSNPTIEALLAAGFVVCGCENYGDGLYGNENCRKACEAFYEHIVANFNVEERCCMIGASNGAQTSINAAYIMGAKVKAMVLQYPLTCLVNQYFNNASQQAGIRSAYGITDTGIDEAGLISATRTHDVLHTDIVDGKKIGYFPPCKLYYSLGDTVVRANVNALALYNVLDASLKVVEKVECTGDHGDVSHFAPADYVSFFTKY